MTNLIFGDIIENQWASKENPIRIGIFVKEKLSTYVMTNGSGKFWEMMKKDSYCKCLGSILNKNYETYFPIPQRRWRAFYQTI
jgi:hypothetical protein